MTTTSGAADLSATFSEMLVDLPNTEPFTLFKAGFDAALAAGRATAAQAGVQDDLITLRKPTTRAEMLWLLKLAHLVISDVDKTLEETFAPAQPAAETSRFGSPELQAMIIARCVEKDQADSVPAVEREQERIAFKDAHRHLELDEVPDAWGAAMFKHSHIEASWLGWIARASHGQAPAGAGEAAEHYRNAIARACEGWTMPDGLRKHLETALWSPPTPQPTQAQAGAVPLTPDQIAEIADAAHREYGRLVSSGQGAPRWSEIFANLLEMHHGIKGGQHG